MFPSYEPWFKMPKYNPYKVRLRSFTDDARFLFML